MSTLAHAPRVDLRAAASREGMGIAVAGLVAVVVSPLVLALGSVLLIGLILGPILLIGGLVAIPYGLYKWAVPMSHHAIRELGSTEAERAAVLDRIEAELATQRLDAVRLASGQLLSLTPGFLVAHGKDLVITRREDLLWGYGKVTTRTRYGITTGRSNDVCIVTRRTGDHTFSTKSEQETAGVLTIVRAASPRAFIGYRDDLMAMGKARLAAEVDRIPFAPGDVPWPQGAPSPSTTPYDAAPVAPAAPSTTPFWILLVAGLAIAGGGLVMGMFFGWIATHPNEPDDVRFGGFCSMASVLVCFAPGAAGTAFAAWRLFFRARGS